MYKIIQFPACIPNQPQEATDRPATRRNSIRPWTPSFHATHASANPTYDIFSDWKGHEIRVLTYVAPQADQQSIHCRIFMLEMEGEQC